eukprot:scaffold30583_cov132-Isochrysis_galbana.AAC.3
MPGPPYIPPVPFRCIPTVGAPAVLSGCGDAMLTEPPPPGTNALAVARSFERGACAGVARTSASVGDGAAVL